LSAGCWADAGFGLWSGSIEIWNKEVRDGAGWSMTISEETGKRGRFAKVSTHDSYDK